MVKFVDLYEACKAGDDVRVHEMLQARAIKLKTSISRLLRAAASSHHHGAGNQDLCDERAPDNTGYSCLHVAALRGHAGVVGELLAYNGQLALTRDRRGCLPLHLAAWHGSAATTEKLLAADAERVTVNARSNCLDTPLHHAVQQSHLKVVRLLLQADADATKRNARGECALDVASRLGRTAICRRLVEHCPALVLQATTDAANAVATHSYGIASPSPSSLRNGNNGSIGGTPAKRTTLMAKFRQSQDKLRSSSLDSASAAPSLVNSQQQQVAYPLHLAARNGHLDTCQLLLDLGFDVDFVTEQGSALHMAAAHAHVDVLQLMLRAGASAQVRDWHGRTVLDVLTEHTSEQASDLTQVMQHRQAWKHCIAILNEHERNAAEQRVPSPQPPSCYTNSPLHHDLEQGTATEQQQSSGFNAQVWQPVPESAQHKIKQVLQLPPPRRSPSRPPVAIASLDSPLTLQAMMIETPEGQDGDSMGPPSTLTVSSEWAHGGSTPVAHPAGGCRYQAAPSYDAWSPTLQQPTNPNQHPHLAYDNVPGNLLAYDNAPPAGHSHWQHSCQSGHDPKQQRSTVALVADSNNNAEHDDAVGATAASTDLRNGNGTLMADDALSAPLATPEEMLVSSVEDTSRRDDEAQLIQQLSQSSVVVVQRSPPAAADVDADASTTQAAAQQQQQVINTTAGNQQPQQQPVTRLQRHKRNSALALQLLQQHGNTNSAAAEPAKVPQQQQRLSNVIPPPAAPVSRLHEELSDWLRSIHVHDNKVAAVADVLIGRGYDRLQFMTESIDVDWLERALDADSCAAILLSIYDDDALLNHSSSSANASAGTSHTRRLPAAHAFSHLSDWLLSLCCEDYLGALMKAGVDSIDKLRRHLQSSPDPRVALHKLLPTAPMGHVHRLLVSLDKQQSPIGQQTGSRPVPYNHTTAHSQQTLSPKQQQHETSPPDDLEVMVEQQLPLPATSGPTAVHFEDEQPPPECTSPAPSYMDANDEAASVWPHASTALTVGSGVVYNSHYLGSQQLDAHAHTTTAADALLLQQARRAITKFKSHARQMSLVAQVQLEISCSAVRLVDAVNGQTIVSHAVSHILRVVQDERDLNCFAYVSQEPHNGHIYAHVFCVLTADLATEIILTMGQAFELIYKRDHDDAQD